MLRGSPPSVVIGVSWSPRTRKPLTVPKAELNTKRNLLSWDRAISIAPLPAPRSAATPAFNDSLPPAPILKDETVPLPVFEANATRPVRVITTQQAAV